MKIPFLLFFILSENPISLLDGTRRPGGGAIAARGHIGGRGVLARRSLAGALTQATPEVLTAVPHQRGQVAPEVEVGDELGSDGALDKVQIRHAGQEVDGQRHRHTVGGRGFGMGVRRIKRNGLVKLDEARGQT